MTMADSPADIASALAVVTTKLDAIDEKLNRAVDDHEARIRRLEAWMYALPASVLLAIASAAASIIIAIRAT